MIFLREGRTEEKGHGTADIHIHSSVADGMADVSQILEYVEEHTDLDVIAITDHDKVEGSFQARELAAKRGYRFEAITGMEVTTAEGHLLALYLESPVPSRKPVEETIAAIHSQGGICIAPHPMSWLTDSLMRRRLEEIVASSEQGLYLDGVETVNATVAGLISNPKARSFNHKHRLAEMGGSDAHFLATVGSGLTLFPGRSAADLKRSILERTTKAARGFKVRLNEVGLIQVVRQLNKSRGIPIRSILRAIRHREFP